MASRTLYPPIVNSQEPAFVVYPQGSGHEDEGELKVYFYFSALSSSLTISDLSVHVKITRKNNNKVLNLEDGESGSSRVMPGSKCLRATGIILNLKPIQDSSDPDLYYVTIKNSDLRNEVEVQSGGDTYHGWIPGWIYKIQLRLSEETCLTPRSQESWLYSNADHFSEWSNFIYAKAISEMTVNINGYDDTTTPPAFSNFKGYFQGEIIGGPSAGLIEDYSMYNIKLYIADENFEKSDLLEDSGELYPTEISQTAIEYYFKTSFQNGCKYVMTLLYKTENGYIEESDYNYDCDETPGTNINLKVITPEDINNEISSTYKTPLFKGQSNGTSTFTHIHPSAGFSIGEDEEEGRISLKLVFINEATSFEGNICIRRSDYTTEFTKWEDITIQYVNLNETNINDWIYYDYTIESGVLYKYVIQEISSDGTRQAMSTPPADNKSIQRVFNFSYIMGQDQRQLKLEFDNNMGNYGIQVSDNKLETLGGKFPWIMRNGDVEYQTFSIGGLISMEMDEHNTFLKNGQMDIYKNAGIVAKQKEYVLAHGLSHRDYTYEREFRKRVLKFLGDGKPKLFKSPTEGNIIVRLTNISCTPNQQIDRLVFTFSATADEIDENSMENYVKYGFYYPGTYRS